MSNLLMTVRVHLDGADPGLSALYAVAFVLAFLAGALGRRR